MAASCCRCAYPQSTLFPWFIDQCPKARTQIKMIAIDSKPKHDDLVSDPPFLPPEANISIFSCHAINLNELYGFLLNI